MLSGSSFGNRLSILNILLLLLCCVSVVCVHVLSCDARNFQLGAEAQGSGDGSPQWGPGAKPW